MILLAAVDDRMGMLFNHRRQSQDRILRGRILALAAGRVLWMNGYSAKQFKEIGLSGAVETKRIVLNGSALTIRVAEDFPDQAASGELCFLENIAPAPYAERAVEVNLFRWNRAYPGDLFFDLILSDGAWRMTETEDFAGFSHEKITMERYTKIR